MPITGFFSALIAAFFVFRPTLNGWEKIIEKLTSEEMMAYFWFVFLCMPVIGYFAACLTWWANEWKYPEPASPTEGVVRMRR